MVGYHIGHFFVHHFSIGAVVDLRLSPSARRRRGRYEGIRAHVPRPTLLQILQIHDLPVAMVNSAVAVGALLLLGVWTLKTYHKYRRSMNGVGWLPGPKHFFSARALFARLLPDIPYVNRKTDWPWKLKYNCKPFSFVGYMTNLYLPSAAAFKAFDGDMFAAVAFWPSVGVVLHTADPHVIKVHSLLHFLTIITRSCRLGNSKLPPTIVLSPSLSPSTK